VTNLTIELQSPNAICESLRDEENGVSKLRNQDFLVVVAITHGLVAELESTSIFLGHVDRHGIHHVTCFNNPLSEDRTRIASKYPVHSEVAPHFAMQIRNISERAHLNFFDFSTSDEGQPGHKLGFAIG
jgi:hypothetical protein